jgi:glutathione S-transferase
MMDDLHKVLLAVLGHMPVRDPKVYNDALKRCKQLAKDVNAALENKQWLVGSEFTYADLYIGVLFQFLF